MILIFRRTICDRMHAQRESLQTVDQEGNDSLPSEAREKLNQATQILHTVQAENQAITDLLLQRLQVLL